MSVYKYAIAIIPDNNLLEEVKQLQLLLANTLTGYTSNTSVIHFTLGEFEANPNALQHIHEQISSVCKHFKPFTVTLSTVNSVTNKIYLTTDTGTTESIKNIASVFNSKFNLKGATNTPCLTIGNNLSKTQLEQALQVLHFTPKNFTTNAISLTKYNTYTKQYQIVHTYNFNE